jgi:hypothetical protein
MRQDIFRKAGPLQELHDVTQHMIELEKILGEVCGGRPGAELILLTLSFLDDPRLRQPVPVPPLVPVHVARDLFSC